MMSMSNPDMTMDCEFLLPRVQRRFTEVKNEAQIFITSFQAVVSKLEVVLSDLMARSTDKTEFKQLAINLILHFDTFYHRILEMGLLFHGLNKETNAIEEQMRNIVASNDKSSPEPNLSSQPDVYHSMSNRKTCTPLSTYQELSFENNTKVTILPKEHGNKPQFDVERKTVSDSSDADLTQKSRKNRKKHKDRRSSREEIAEACTEQELEYQQLSIAKVKEYLRTGMCLTDDRLKKKYERVSKHKLALQDGPPGFTPTKFVTCESSGSSYVGKSQVKPEISKHQKEDVSQGKQEQTVIFNRKCEESSYDNGNKLYLDNRQWNRSSQYIEKKSHSNNNVPCSEYSKVKPIDSNQTISPDLKKAELNNGTPDNSGNNLKAAKYFNGNYQKHVQVIPSSNSQSTQSESSKTTQSENNDIEEINSDNFQKQKCQVISEVVNTLPITQQKSTILTCKRQIGAQRMDVLKETAHLPMVIEENDSCLITYVESPSLFYVIAGYNASVIYDGFHETLDTHCRSSAALSFDSKETAIMNNAEYLCCLHTVAEYPYKWFRCKVVDWFLNSKEYEDSVQVFCVDDGATKIIKLRNIRDFPKTVENLPPLAVQCRLAYLYPPGSTPQNMLTTWPNDSLTFFANFAIDSLSKPFVISYLEKCSNTTLLDCELPGGLKLTVVMCSMGYAVPILPQDSTEDGMYISSDIMKKQILNAQGINNMEFDWDNLDDCKDNYDQAVSNAVSGGYTAQDEARLCKFTKVTGKKCFKGDRCKFEHKLKNPDGWTTDKELVLCNTMHNTLLPQVNLTVSLVVVCITKAFRFFAHIKPVYRTHLSICNSAGKLSRYINKPDNLKGLKRLQILPAVGQLVLAYSSKDDAWYRARVVSICSEDEFWVHYIDYGDTASVKFEELRKIQKEHLGLPVQAIEFKIANAAPLPDCHGNIVENVLSDLLLDTTVTALILSNAEPIEVEIYDSNHVNIGEKLIEMGCAIRRSPCSDLPVGLYIPG